MDDLTKFVDFLYGDGKGYVYAPSKSEDGRWNYNHFFLWPSQREDLLEWVALQGKIEDLYISPALFSERVAIKENICYVGVAWLEFDGKASFDLRDIPEPDIVIRTSSETHLHCYWKIEPTEKWELVEEANRRITYYLEADSSGWDATQVLRPPTTFNFKYNRGNPDPVSVIVYRDGSPKNLSVFDPAPEVTKAPISVIYDDLLRPEKVMADHAFPEELKRRITAGMALPKQRSSYLMQLGYVLAEEGLDALEIVSLLYVVDCRIKKFVGRNDQLLRLSEIASIALAKFESENAIAFYTPNQIINHQVKLTWVIDGWLHTNGIMMVTGAPSVGKTQFSLDLAYRIGSGESVLQKPAVSPVEIAFISLEMDVIELQYIFDHQGREFGQNNEVWNRNLKVFPFDEHDYTAMEKIFKEHKPKVVVIDSLTELAQDSVSDEKEARRIMAWLKRMRRTYGHCQIIIHHNRKANDSNKKPKKLSDLYGSFIFAKLSETVISLWQEEGKSYLDLHGLKMRFGKSENLRIKRTDNLTFELLPQEITVGTGTGGNPLLRFE